MKRLIIMLVLLPSVGVAAPMEVDSSSLVTTGTEWGTYGVGLVRSAQELESSYDALTDHDATCMNFSPTGAPEVPASCAGNETCGQCYTVAIRELNGMRLNLERLRCYYSAYKRFVDASVAFGDSASGIHAVTGLAWQSERAGILAAMDSLNRTYDTKYAQMMPNLRAALEKVGGCEADYFQERDWYARFGFIYYTFMSDRYKR